MSERLKSFLAWTVLVALFGSLFTVLTAPTFSEITDLQHDYARKTALLERLQSLPKKEALIRERLQKLSDQAAERYLYVGEVNAVQSQIQRDIRSLAAGNNIQIASMRPLAGRSSNSSVTPITIQFSSNMTHDQLLGFLAKLEAQTPTLRVKKLTVKVGSASDAYTPARLQVMGDINGFKASRGKGGA